MFSRYLWKLLVIVAIHKGDDNFCCCLLSLTIINSMSDEIIVLAEGETDGSWFLGKKADGLGSGYNLPHNDPDRSAIGRSCQQGKIHFLGMRILWFHRMLPIKSLPFLEKAGLGDRFRMHNDRSLAINFYR